MTLTSEPGLAGGGQPGPHPGPGPYRAPGPHQAPGPYPVPGQGGGSGQGDGRYPAARPGQAADPYLAASPYPGDAYPRSNGAYPDPVPAQAGSVPPGPAAPPAPAVAVQICWMCGIRQPATLMVPDGGAGCPDIRWYCQDARQCTERWTSHRPPAPI